MTAVTPKRLFAWFSARMLETMSRPVYVAAFGRTTLQEGHVLTLKTPSGSLVHATMICDSDTDSGTAWDDIVCLGEVLDENPVRRTPASLWGGF